MTVGGVVGAGCIPLPVPETYPDRYKIDLVRKCYIRRHTRWINIHIEIKTRKYLGVKSQIFRRDNLLIDKNLYNNFFIINFISIVILYLL